MTLNGNKEIFQQYNTKRRNLLNSGKDRNSFLTIKNYQKFNPKYLKFPNV